MKIYIEGLIILILIIMFISWKYWLGWSTKRLLKKYNPDDDRGRKIEDFGADEGRNKFVEESAISN